MKPFERRDELAEALRDSRPTPEPEFAAELDARAAGGLPARPRRGVARSAGFARAAARIPPRRLLVPAGALSPSSAS